MTGIGESHRPDEPGVSAGSPESRETLERKPGKPETKEAKVRLGRVLLVVAPVAILAVMAVAFIPYFDLDALLDRFSRPALAPVRGQAFFNGEPLPNAQVATQPMGRGRSALGWTDDEGKFTLKTDIQGELVEGATVGEHRVAVTVYQMIPGPAAPPLLTPQQYASAGTSPLRIMIGQNPDQNQFELKLEGEPPRRPERPGNGKAKASEGASEEASAEAPAQIPDEAPDEK